MTYLGASALLGLALIAAPLARAQDSAARPMSAVDAMAPKGMKPLPPAVAPAAPVKAAAPAPVAAPPVKKKTLSAENRSHSNSPVSPVIVTPAPDSKMIYEEAAHLLIADQPYRIRYEEDGAAQLIDQKATEFSAADVAQFAKAVETLRDYRQNLRTRCGTESSALFANALDQYTTALVTFHRRGLPVVANLAENNDRLVLVVNRSTLLDAAVLVSRYLNFKKQRFKDQMPSFLEGDGALVEALGTIARVLKVAVPSDEMQKVKAPREEAIEIASLWPRTLMFAASQRLSDARERACVSAPAVKPSAQLAE